MSYILDALKRAERDRPSRAIPTLKTVHPRPPFAPGRWLWPWAGALVVVASAGVLIWILRSGGTLGTGIPASSPPAPAARESTADPARRAGPSDTPAAVVTAPSNRPALERASPAAARPMETVRPPSVALAPAVLKSEPTKPRAVDERPKQTARSAPEKPPVSTPATPIPRIAPGPNPPSPVPGAPSPPMPADLGARSLPGVGEATPADQELIRRMRLQVVVYSEVPSQRLVFIDNHKYVEGESIGGKVLVESIAPDGAVLMLQGRRFKLRAPAE